MQNHLRQTASRLLNVGYDEMSTLEQRVVRRFVERKQVSRNTNAEFRDQLTFGQRLADRVAAIGGSWGFIIAFGSVMLVWVALNSFLLARRQVFDPYPYILLNLFLSMVASVQAPVIMMSQNRQSAKDRLDAAHDYEVNLKAELEILELHHKLDALREQQWNDLVAMQQEQIRLLTSLLKEGQAADTGPTPSENQP